MKSSALEQIDYVHADCGFAPDEICECFWNFAYRELLTEGYRHEYPIYVRREYFDRTSAIAHRHNDFLAIQIVRSGRGTHVINGRAHSVARGDIFLMTLDAMQCFRAPVELTVDVVYFQTRLWSPTEWDILCQMPDLAAFFTPGEAAHQARGNTDYFGHLTPEPHAQVEETLRTMRQLLDCGDLPRHLAARGRFFALLIQLAEWRADKTITTRPARGAGIAEVLSFCDRNFHRALTNDQLAALMHFSEAHFREVFHREVGMPPGAYLRHLRLQYAQKLLEDKDLPIADIARLSGFGEPSHLSHAFKTAFGVSPLDFRKKQLARL